MLKVFLFQLLLTSNIQFTLSQENFKWDVVIDSLEGTSNQLYTKTKLFIGEYWKSAQNVIQIDEKEEGIVLVKGNRIEEMTFALNKHTWVFRYSIKFLIKDTKCRIIIDDVYCESANCEGTKWPLLPVSNTYPKGGYWKTSIGKDRYIEIMMNLKNELNLIVASYINYLKKPLVYDSDW